MVSEYTSLISFACLWARRVTLCRVKSPSVIIMFTCRLVFCKTGWWLTYTIEIWAATWQNQQNECALSEDSGQPGHPPSLLRVFAMRSVDSYGPKLSSCGQLRLWSDWADAKADLRLRWAHNHFVGFVMSRLIFNFAWTPPLTPRLRCKMQDTRIWGPWLISQYIKKKLYCLNNSENIYYEHYMKFKPGHTKRYQQQNVLLWVLFFWVLLLVYIPYAYLGYF